MALYIDDLKGVAKEMVKKDGEHMPMFFIIDKDEKVNVVAVEHGDEPEEKEHVVEEIRRIIDKFGSNRYFYVASAWMVSRKDVEKEIKKELEKLKQNPSKDATIRFLQRAAELSLKPSMNELRKDVLVISEFEKGIGMKTIVIPYESGDDGEIHFGEEEQLDGRYQFNMFNVWAKEQFEFGDDSD